MDIIKYITGPLQLAGITILALAALVSKLAQSRDDKNRRVLVWGLLGLGGLGVLGGIGLEAAKLLHPMAELSEKPPATKPAIAVDQNHLDGTGNTLGVDPARFAERAGNVSVSGNTVSGDSNVVGVGNLARPAGSKP